MDDSDSRASVASPAAGRTRPPAPESCAGRPGRAGRTRSAGTPAGGRASSVLAGSGGSRGLGRPLVGDALGEAAESGVGGDVERALLGLPGGERAHGAHDSRVV